MPTEAVNLSTILLTTISSYRIWGYSNSSTIHIGHDVTQKVENAFFTKRKTKELKIHVIKNKFTTE